MALNYLLDTNTVLYHLQDRIDPPIDAGRYAVSVITELELLSFPRMSTEEEGRVRNLLAALGIVELTAAVKARTIAVRRSHGLKLADAIIAATALDAGVTLMSADAAFARVTGLALEVPALKPA